MFLKRSIIGLPLLLLTAPAILADDATKNPEPASVWVTSVSQIGSSDHFAAGVANGLLLRESKVMKFDTGDMTKMSPLYSHPAAVWCIDSTSDGKSLASVDYRGNLVTYDVASKKATTHEKAFERWCQSMLISPDNKHIVAGNEAGKLMVWDIATNKVTKSVDLDAHAITGLSISPDAAHLAVSDGAGHVHLMKWPGLEEVGKIEVAKETLWCVAFSNDGKKIFAGSSDRNLYSCEAKADAKATSVAKGKDWITRIAISPNGQVAASEVGGRLHFPSLGGTDSMDAKSGVWALCWNGNEQLIAGTRKHGLVTAGRSWKWTEAKKPEAQKPEAKKPEPEAKKEEPTKKDEKPMKEKPEAKKPAKKTADEKPADKKADAKEKPAEKPKVKKKAADKPKADKKKPKAKPKAAAKEEKK